MSNENELEPLRSGAELMLQLAQKAIEKGDSQKARDFVMKAVRQGLIIRHLKESNKISNEEIERIMAAEPEELYQIFAGEEGEEYPINTVNYADIRRSLERLV